MTNIGGRRADEALKALAGQLYKSFAPTAGRDFATKCARWEAHRP
jgi:hypothetical protein